MRHRLNYTIFRKPIHGFTLIELLVVISIIALLLSILMPALGLAKQQAQYVVCRSNMKNIGMVERLYSEDWDGKIIGGWAWESELPYYYGSQPSHKSVNLVLQPDLL